MRPAVKVLLGILGAVGASIGAVVGYGVLGLKPALRPAPDLHVQTTPERIERGKYLANHLCACVDCHTDHDTSRADAPWKDDALFAGGLHLGHEVGLPGEMYTPNLTPDPETGLGSWTDGEIVRAIREGVSRDGHALFPQMPYTIYRAMSDDDVTAIVAYLRSLPPKKNPIPKTTIDFPVSIFIKLVPQPITAPVAPPSDPGAYALAMAACAECHSPQEQGKVPAGMEYAGGFEFRGPWGSVWSSNISSDPTTGIGRATDAQIELAIRAGLKIDGQKMIGPMPSRAYAGLTPSDLTGLVAALRKVPPKSHAVPPRREK